MLLSDNKIALNNYAIFTKDLSKSYGKVLAVKKLNLKIPYGTIFGLLGPNGAGKTTTIRLLNAIIKPSSGNAIVSGYDIQKEKTMVKLNCGFLPETPGLYNKLTTREFLEFVGSLYNLSQQVLTLRIDELLELFDLKQRENDLIEEYSRGMKQKVSMCATLIHNPKIIFLDEPTSNLDPAAASMVKSLIISLINNAQKTFFISTHITTIAEDLCDTIGIIDNGMIKIQGSPNELIESVDASNLENLSSN
ncbi:MAG: ABC transporter ATP-binding protein [Candidatus Lokiarchaeota archaeon]